MTHRDVLYFLFRWKWTIFGWWFIVFALVVVLGFVLPPTYRATSTILVERTKSQLITPTPPGVMPVPEMVEAMNTERQIVTSRPVIAKVVDDLHLLAGGAQKDVVAQGQQEPDATVDSDTAGAADQTPAAEESSRFQFTETIPAREAKINEVRGGLKVKPVVDSNVLTISYSGEDPVLVTNVVNAITDTYISRRRNIYARSGTSEYFWEKMQEAAAELARLRDRLADFKKRYSLSAVKDTKEELVREIGVLRDRLSTLKEELAENRTRYADTHPRIKIVKQKIASAEGELRSRNDELLELDQLEATTNDLNVLIDSQEKVLVNYKTRFEEERAREDTPEHLVNARVIEYATVPHTAEYPKSFLAKVGLLAGLFFALIVAFVRNYFYQQVDNPAAAESALGVPCLGSIAKNSGVSRT